MPSYKLTYFNFRGRAEVIRMLFHLAGEDFEDDRINRAEWDQYKSTSLTGQLPYLTVDGQVLYQSNAIGRYLAEKFGLAGKNEWDKARAEMVVYMTEDMLNPVSPAIFREKDPDKKNTMRQKYETDQLPKFLDIFDKLLVENGGQFFVGNEVTWADLTVMNTFQMMENKRCDVTFPWDKYPDLKAFLSRLENEPKIAEFIAKRPPADL